MSLALLAMTVIAVPAISYAQTSSDTGTGTTQNPSTIIVPNSGNGNNTLQSALLLNGLNNNRTNLGDLFVLDQLFGRNSGILGSNTGGTNLGNLFVLDQLFGGTSGVLGNNGILGGGGVLGNNNSLGDLFVLDQLFGRSSNGILNNSNGTNLGDLFILDQLFR